MSGTLSDSNLGRVALIPEVTLGTTPASPALQTIRLTSSDFAATKETVVSDELRADRMVSNVAEVAAMAGGSINLELSLGGSYDSLIEAALCGTFTTALNANTTVAAAATTNKFTGTGLFTNTTVGQWVFASGWTNASNNGWHRVTARTNDEITVASTLVTETGSATKRVQGRMVRNGVVRRSFSIEQAFTDVAQFFIYRGQRVGSMSLDISSGAIITGSMGFQGLSNAFAASTFAGSIVAATSTPTVNATSNVGAVLESGTYAALGVSLQSASINLDNALRNQMAIGSKFPVGIGYGRQTVSGSMVAYFQDTTLYTKFLNHTATALSFAVTDGLGNALRITLPRVFFQTSNPALAGIDQDVVENIDWTAVLDPATGCQIQVDAITAA